MTWTKVKPTEPGFYWHFHEGLLDVIVVKKTEHGLYVTGLNSLCLYSMGHLENLMGEFQGPISPVEEG